MGQDKEQLKQLLAFVKSIYLDPDNKEFAAGIQSLVGSSVGSLDLNANVNEIRKALQLRGNLSIDYTFVKEDNVRKQLEVDNLRMENSVLDFISDEPDRYHSYCVAAFYQVENLLNYYFATKYPIIEEFLAHLEERTRNDKYPFYKSGDEKNVGNVPVEKKIYVFSCEFFPYDASRGIIDFTGNVLTDLRKVRNEGFHRCSITQIEISEQTKELHKANKKWTYSQIRNTVIAISDKVRENLSTASSYIPGVISSMLPGCAFVKIKDGHTFQLPSNLFLKFKDNISMGCNISVRLYDNKVIDIQL